MIHVDTNNEYVQTWKLNRDMRYVCPVLYIVFQTTKQYNFSDDGSCLVFRDSEWTPFQYNESVVSGGYIYSLSCYPTEAFKIVERFYSDTSALASAFNLRLLGNTSPVKFDVPTTGLTLVKLLVHHRKNSMLVHWNELELASYFYFEGGNLLSSTFGDLLRSNTREASVNKDTMLSSTFGFADAVRYHNRMLESPPEFQTYEPKLDTLFGKKFTLESPHMYMPGVVYSGVTSSDWHNEVKKVICLSCVGSSEWAPNVWHTIFAELHTENKTGSYEVK